MKTNNTIPSSFRDPSGFLFYQDGIIYRQINQSYQEDYDSLMSSGLYDELVEKKLLLRHEEVDLSFKQSDLAYKVIKPEHVPFISYPYEWCFSQLKSAALTTLKIQKIALDNEMILKDASAYNIQFLNGKPTLIDTLSFEKYSVGDPWVAYRQFCQHFLAPLALISYTDIRLNQLSRVFIDGLPLDLTSKLLPLKTNLKFTLLSHIHLHAKSQGKFADSSIKTFKKERKSMKMSRFAMLGLIDNLLSAVKKLKWQPKGTEWGDYYDNTNYSTDGLDYKKELVGKFIDLAGPKSLWDLGANTGLFSQIAADRKIPTVSFDIDPAAVEKNFLRCTKEGETNILPLLLDLTNPSSDIGWHSNERMSFISRGPVDAVLALALIHHLAISNNLPLLKTAEFFSDICKYLIIEFVPKSDSQVQRLLSSREDIFPNYTQEDFEKDFSVYFTIRESEKISDTERTLYLMERKQV